MSLMETIGLVCDEMYCTDQERHDRRLNLYPHPTTTLRPCLKIRTIKVHVIVPSETPAIAYGTNSSKLRGKAQRSY